MKRMLFLLLLCLLLCGCARELQPEETAPPPTSETAALQTSGTYAPGHPLEELYRGSLRVYPQDIRQVLGMRAMGDSLLLFSGYGTTTLTMLTGEELSVSGSITLDFELDARDSSLCIQKETLSYFDPVARETVVRNAVLREVSRYPAPEDLVGSPILSADRSTIYYCTPTDVRAWDLESGIRRCVKEMCYQEQEITGVHLDGTVLQCRVLDNGQERTLLLAADTGRLLYETGEAFSLRTEGSRYCLTLNAGLMERLIFGEAEGKAEILLPENIGAEGCFPEGSSGAVTIALSQEDVLLEYYDLDSGKRRSALTLDEFSIPAAITGAGDDFLYLLCYDPAEDRNVIYRWDFREGSSLLVQENTDYTGFYVISGDADATARCQAYADQLGAQYGIEILTGETAAGVQPWDYDLEAEIQPAVIQRELELLEQRLAHYPEGMLAQTASNFTGLKLCLVRSITGSAESGSLGAATGVQFLDGTDAYVAIAVGKYAEQALYHELFHAMETHILNYSIAFDQWNSLNPAGFDYAYGYSANENRDAGIYLQPEYRAFVDSYSMSFPKEDRARIMEYAMLPGNEALFEAPAIQAKLSALCEGIREAYGLEKAEETFLWEQYLE